MKQNKTTTKARKKIGRKYNVNTQPPASQVMAPKKPAKKAAMGKTRKPNAYASFVKKNYHKTAAKLAGAGKACGFAQVTKAVAAAYKKKK